MRGAVEMSACRFLLWFAQMSTTRTPTASRSSSKHETVRTRVTALGQYQRDVDARPRLSRAEEDTLGVRAVKGDIDARNALVEGNLRLVPRVVRKFMRDGVDFEDLVQAGNQGLIRAAEKWDPAACVPFGAYAPDWIERFAREIIAKDGYATRIPLYRQETFVAIQRARLSLEQRLGREATPLEVAEAATEAAKEGLARKAERRGWEPTEDELRKVTVSPSEVEEAHAHQSWGVALDEPMPGNKKGSNTLSECLADPESVGPSEITEQREARRIIEDALNALPDRERTILLYYYGLQGYPERTLEQIGDILGFTRERVRQLKEKAVASLRDHPLLGSLMEG